MAVRRWATAGALIAAFMNLNEIAPGLQPRGSGGGPAGLPGAPAGWPAAGPTGREDAPVPPRAPQADRTARAGLEGQGQRGCGVARSAAGRVPRADHSSRGEVQSLRRLRPAGLPASEAGGASLLQARQVERRPPAGPPPPASAACGSVDGDEPRGVDRLPLRNDQLQDAVHVGRLDLVAVDILGEREPAQELAARPTQADQPRLVFRP